MKLDKLDKKILKLLQDNARMKYSEIGKVIGKPTSTVFERVKRLENTGVITGYTTLIDPEKAEKGVTAYLLGQAALGESTDLDEVGKMLADMPEVYEVHFITGDYDYLIKLRVKDQKEYYRVIKDIAKGLITRGKGMIVPKTFKEKHTIDV